MVGAGSGEMSSTSGTVGMDAQISCQVNGNEMRLQQLIGAVVNSTSEQTILELVNFLDSVSNSIILEVETEESGKMAFETLDKIHQFVCVPWLNQEVIDMLAFELPKAVTKLGCLSPRCSELTKKIIDWFVGHCSPRDMLSVFCEALGSPSELFVIPSYFVPLLVGLSKDYVLGVGAQQITNGVVHFSSEESQWQTRS
ncbi:aberrant root formation protein 4-like isoform X2 [Henckelia pumila]|uniref:aberrant root formation protein 4-like isoform X2 n=1 Tax=Henckelia pumila TaxID=405737 RepID=UPI003C6E7EC2